MAGDYIKRDDEEKAPRISDLRMTQKEKKGE